jgi:steroid delta-isomerase-like uncharacterized protein
MCPIFDTCYSGSSLVQRSGALRSPPPFGKGTRACQLKKTKALARRFADDILNRGNVDVVDEIYTPDYVGHDPAMPEDVHGIEGAKENYNMILSAFPDIQITIEDQVAEGGTVVSRWTMRATHQGELMDIPPSGKRVEFMGVSISRIEGGKIVEDWDIYDALGMMQHIGAIPEPGQQSSV